MTTGPGGSEINNHRSNVKAGARGSASTAVKSAHSDRGDKYELRVLVRLLYWHEDRFNNAFN